jgi:hypothetical protein
MMNPGTGAGGTNRHATISPDPLAGTAIRPPQPQQEEESLLPSAPSLGHTTLPPVNVASEGASFSLAGPSQNDNTFPSNLVCPISTKPPFNPVTFDVSDPSGFKSKYVFEYSNLYRLVSHVRDEAGGQEKMFIKHPLLNAKIGPGCGSIIFHSCTRGCETDIHAKRVKRGLPLRDPEPLDHQDFMRMNKTQANAACATGEL